MSKNNKLSKKLLIAFAILLFIILGALLSLRVMLSSEAFQNKIKQIAIQQAKEKLGLELTFQQDFGISIFPDLGIYIKQVSLSPLAGKTPAIYFEGLHLAQADIEVGLLSLFSDSPQVRVISLRDVRLSLPPQGPIKNNITIQLSKVMLSGIANLNGGRLLVEGQANWLGGQMEFGLSTQASLADASHLALNFEKLSGKLTLNGREPMDINAQGLMLLSGKVPISGINKLEDFASVALEKIYCRTDALTLEINGQLSPADLSGQVKLSLHGSSKPLLNFMGYAFASAQAAGQVKLALDISGQHKMWQINQLLACLDDMELEASGSFASNDKLSLKGSMDLGHLQIENYFLRPTEAPAGAPTAPTAPTNALGSAHPVVNGEEPARLPAGLAGAELEIAITAQQISYAEHKLNDFTATLLAHNGYWRLQPIVAIYLGGKLDIGLNANLNQTPSAIQASGQAINLDLSQLSSQAKGTVQAVDFHLSSRADSLLLHHLSGQIAFKAANVSALQLALPAPLNSGSGQVTFDTVTSSFNLHNGLAHSTNLYASGKQMQILGQGEINLPQQALNMHLVIKMAGVMIKGVDSIPLIVRGTFRNPSISIDALKMAELTANGLLQEQVGKPLQNAPANIGNLLRSIGR